MPVSAGLRGWWEEHYRRRMEARCGVMLEHGESVRTAVRGAAPGRAGGGRLVILTDRNIYVALPGRIVFSSPREGLAKYPLGSVEASAGPTGFMMSLIVGDHGLNVMGFQRDRVAEIVRANQEARSRRPQRPPEGQTVG